MAGDADAVAGAEARRVGAEPAEQQRGADRLEQQHFAGWVVLEQSLSEHMAVFAALKARDADGADLLAAELPPVGERPGKLLELRYSTGLMVLTAKADGVMPIRKSGQFAS